MTIRQIHTTCGLRSRETTGFPSQPLCGMSFKDRLYICISDSCDMVNVIHIDQFLMICSSTLWRQSAEPDESHYDANMRLRIEVCAQFRCNLVSEPEGSSSLPRLGNDDTGQCDALVGGPCVTADLWSDTSPPSVEYCTRLIDRLQHFSKHPGETHNNCNLPKLDMKLSIP